MPYDPSFYGIFWAVFHYLRGFCRDFVVNFAVDFSVDFLSFVCRDGGSRKATRNPQKKFTQKIHDKIHALRMKIYHDECSAEGQS